MGAEISIQSLDQLRHFDDGILAHLGPRAMHCHAEGFHIRPEASFVFEDRLQIGGLCNDGKGIVCAVMLREMSRAMLIRLF